jgi:putative inorganic carbon (HCO3(-)) transporter
MSKRKQPKTTSNIKAPSASTVTLPKNEKAKQVASGLNSMTNWLILLVLILPLVYSAKVPDPVFTPRHLFLTGFLLLFMLYFFAARKTVIAHNLPPLLKIVFAAGIGFTIWNVIAATSSLNPQESFFEIAKQLLFLLALILVTLTFQREESQLLRLCKAMVWVAVIQGLAGILQYYDIAFTEVPGANAKPYGMMANRNLFGSAQAFVLPFSLYVLYKGSRTWKYISGAAIAIIIISLLLSQTRSAWLASAAAVIVSLLLVLIFSPVNRKQWIIGTLTGSALVALLTLLLLAGNDEELQQSIGARTKSLVMQSDDTTQVAENVDERIKIWKKTIKLIEDKPIAGAGPGNWKLIIPSYGTEGLAWAGGHYAPDRVHNIYLMVAAETGIPGALFYFGMWLLIAVAAFRVIIKPRSEEQRIMVILMLAGLAAVACDGMFSFPTERIEHSLYMLLMGGIILGCYLNVTMRHDVKNGPLKKSWLVLGSAILLFNLFIGFKKHAFESRLNRVIAFEKLGRFKEMADEAKEGKDLYITLGASTGISMELKRSIALKKLQQYDEALKEISIAKRYHPNSAAVWNTEGTIYTELKKYDKAIECYRHAQKITPQYDVVLKNLAINYFMTNDFTNCIATVEQMKAPRETYYDQLLANAKSKMAATK